MLNLSATAMARMIREREISSVELVSEHLKQIRKVNPQINAVVDLLDERALCQAEAADERLARGETPGPLHGVPVSIKDSIDIQGTRSTAGTLGRKHAPPALRDATLVERLRAAGAIPIAKTNLPDLLFAFETDNLIYGRTNNPYDLARTSGGSSGGESALIAACGSPLGLGSDCAGSVRVPAHFCGIASIKPTSGRLPRTGHVPPAGGWIEALWQIGPMARYTEDLELAMRVLTGEDGEDFTSPPVPLIECGDWTRLRVAFFTDNGFARSTDAVKDAVLQCAEFLAAAGMRVEEAKPPGVEDAFDLEFRLLGADGVDGIDAYLRDAGSIELHPLLAAWLDRMRPLRATASELASQWTRWDEYRVEMAKFFGRFDAVLCPVYTQPALQHGDSVRNGNFEGFSYTMAWNLAGAPAVSVRCSEVRRSEGDALPINIQVVTKPWRDMTALAISKLIEAEFGGWKPPKLIFQERTETIPATAR